MPVGARPGGGAPEAVVQRQLLAVLGVADVRRERQATGVVGDHGGQGLVDHVLQAGAVALDADRRRIGLRGLGPHGRQARHRARGAPHHSPAHSCLPGMF